MLTITGFTTPLVSRTKHNAMNTYDWEFLIDSHFTLTQLSDVFPLLIIFLILRDKDRQREDRQDPAAHTSHLPWCKTYSLLNLLKSPNHSLQYWGRVLSLCFSLLFCQTFQNSSFPLQNDNGPYFEFLHLTIY